MAEPEELLPLIPPQTNTYFSFFSKAKAARIVKNTSCAIAGTVSGIMYWSPSYQAAAGIAGNAFQYVTALGGSCTNAIFNIESFLDLFDAAFHKMPYKYLAASALATFCVLPTFLMNIEDEQGNYIANADIALQGFLAFLNVLVNIVGAVELINSLFALHKTKTQREKENLIERFSQLITNFYQNNYTEQTEAKLRELIEKQFKPQTQSQKTIQASVKSLLALISIPQLLAYTMLSYFDVKELAEKKWRVGSIGSNTFGVVAAIGNTIPGTGFSIKGINSICKNLYTYKRPSLLALFFILPAAFSGFTTHQAMQQSLKHLNYSGGIAEALAWIANLGAAFIYNLPQMIHLADRVIEKKNNETPEAIKNSIQAIKTYIEALPPAILQASITEPAANQQFINTLFRQAGQPMDHHNHIPINTLTPRPNSQA
jgi:hypothetical protein